MKKYPVYLLFFMILFSNPVLGQKDKSSLEVKIGYGYYQGFNIGLNYFYTDRLKLGLGVGSHLNLPPLENENHFNIFIKTKKFINLWFYKNP